MELLVAYDVATATEDGQRRLRKVATACCDFGQRVQKSVFECSLTVAQYEQLKHRLLDCIDLKFDSLRIYRLPTPKVDCIEHFGVGEPLNFQEPLII